MMFEWFEADQDLIRISQLANEYDHIVLLIGKLLAVLVDKKINWGHIRYIT